MRVTVRRDTAGVVLLALVVIVLLLTATVTAAAPRTTTLTATVPSAAPAPVAFLLSDLWSWRNPLPAGNEFQAVSMPNEHHAWAVTGYGGIYGSVDGGKHWWLQASRGTDAWRSVFFLDANRGWVVGINGAMRRTIDGGATWKTCASGTTQDLQDVHFTSAQRGWAVGFGKTLLSTSDGGATWAPRAVDAGAATAYTGVEFRNELRGWVCDNVGGVLRTVDGGATWQRTLAADGAVLFDVCFATANRGWAVGGFDNIGVVAATVDGGLTWQWQTSASSSIRFNAVRFVDASKGWVCRDEGPPLFTSDGGAHWNEIPSLASFDVRDLGTADGLHAVVVGDDVATTDDGATWARRTTSVTTANLDSIAFADKRYGWAVGDGGAILRTRDGGTSWQRQSSPYAEDIKAVAAASTARAVAVGSRNIGGQWYGFILRTNNGGATWTDVAGSISGVNDVDFVSSLRGWIAWEGGLLRTSDGGLTWTALPDPTGTHYSILGVDFVSRSSGLLCTGGDHGLYRTTDAGVTATPIGQPAWNLAPRALSFADLQHGWIVWLDGRLAGTTNGGTSWSQQAIDAGEVFVDVAAQSASRAWAVGQLGTVYRTVDGGQHWTKQNGRTGTGVTLNAVTATGGNVWAVGDGGVIIGRNFTPLPHVVRATPSPLDVGDKLVIDGWGFGASRGAGYVLIGGKKVTGTVFWRDLRVRFVVPSLTAGVKNVQVVAGGVASNTVTVQVR